MRPAIGAEVDSDTIIASIPCNLSRDRARRLARLGSCLIWIESLRSDPSPIAKTSTAQCGERKRQLRPPRALLHRSIARRMVSNTNSQSDSVWG
jgi:hypothetical protein